MSENDFGMSKPTSHNDRCVVCGADSVRGRYGFYTALCVEHSRAPARRTRRRVPFTEQALRKDNWKRLEIGRPQ